MERIEGSQYVFKVNKLELIKLVREANPSLSLLECKNLVEAYLVRETLDHDDKIAIQTVKGLKQTLTPEEYQSILKGLE